MLLMISLKLDVPLPVNNRIQKGEVHYQYFEQNVISRFLLIFLALHSNTGCPVSSCGFSQLLSDPNHERSPDGFVEAFLVELKARAEMLKCHWRKSLAHMSIKQISICVVLGDR